MATTVLMPQMGYDMREGTVVKWLKKEGEEVTRGEILAEIETDKAVVEMEALGSGLVRKIVVPEGMMVPVGEVIAIIGTADEELPALGKVEAAAGPAGEAIKEAPKAEQEKVAPKEERAAAQAGEIKASPIARRLAKEKGVDLTQVKGTGPGGRIVEKDVLAFEEAMKEAAPAALAEAPAVEVAPGRVDLTRMRQTIARRTADSKRETPHFYVTVEVDMTRAMALRKQLNEELKDEVRISVNDLIIKATTKALGKFPNFNASFKGDHLEVYPSVHMGIAIALEQGLMVPAIPNCDKKSLVEIAKASRDLGERAHGGKLRAEEYTGGTFSISNLGMFDVDSFSAIIFPPNAAVLAVGSVKPQPVVRDGEIKVAQVMKATVSVDHRVADGAEAARFLTEVKHYLEQPMLMLV